MSCPTLGLTLSHAERASHLAFQVHGFSLEAGTSGAAAASAAAVAVGGAVRGERGVHVVQMPMPEAAAATYCCQFNLGREQQAAAAAAADGSDSSGGGAGARASAGPPHPGHVYADSLVSSYLPHGRLSLAPALLRLQPSTLSEALVFIERVKTAFEAGLPARENALQEAEPLQSTVIAAYKRHGVPLPYALSAFFPTLAVTCPRLVAVAALRDGGGLRSGPLGLGVGGRHELVGVLENVAAGVRCAGLGVLD